MAQRGDEGLLAQGHSHGTLHGLEGLGHTGLAVEHFDDVPAKAAVHEVRQDADFDMAEHSRGDSGA